MNTEKTQILLCDNGSPIHADMESFFEFSFWLAEELEDLVACRRIKPAQTETPSFDR